MRRWPLGLLIALALVLTIVASAHAYFIQRLVVDSGLRAPWSSFARAAIVGGAVLLFAHPIAERRFRLSPRAAALLGWPAYVWLGTCFYLLLLLCLSDMVLGALALLGASGDPGPVRAVIVLFAVTLVVAYGMWNALYRGPRVVRVELWPHAWPDALDGYRIAQISDIHIGTLLGAEYARRVTDRCNALRPDAIAVTGDVVDGSVAKLADRVRPFADLNAPDGVFFVTGNHDHYSGADGWSAKLQSLGFQILRNRRVRIERMSAAFEIAGVDDYSSRRRVEQGGGDFEAALAGWHAGEPLVLLAHDPRSFEQARTRGVPLQLSGHTHAGQMWPFGWLVRLQTRYVAGAYRSGDSQLYVNRGTGFWGPPLRVFKCAEISELVLRAPGST
jgi:predicted MPP superfamily phosphohydrolase